MDWEKLTFEQLLELPPNLKNQYFAWLRLQEQLKELQKENDGK